jgi:hypothetical protein
MMGSDDLMADSAMGGMPPLGGIPNLSTGPAVSEAEGGENTSKTGAFNFKSGPGLIQQLAPIAAVGLIAWLLLKKK